MKEVLEKCNERLPAFNCPDAARLRCLTAFRRSISKREGRHRDDRRSAFKPLRRPPGQEESGGRCERVAGQLLFKISRKRRSECREKAIPLTKVRRIAGNRSQARQTKAECPHHMPSSTSKESFNTNNYPTVREDTYEGCRFQVSRLRDATKISRSQKQGIKQDHGVGFNSIHRSWKGGRWQVCNSLVYRVADLDPERTTRVAASLRGCG